MTETILDVRDISFGYHDQPVLEAVSLQIKRGDFLAVIGPNGGGKTTLLKLMLGLLRPGSGRIRVLGTSPRNVSHKIGYVPQDVHINPYFPISVLDVVLMGRLNPRRWHKRPSRRDRREAQSVLERLSMGSYCHRRMGELSGGERQRVFIARALATEPELLFLDEPTASIDTRGQTELYQLLKGLNQHITIVLVSHDLMVLSGFIKSVACVNRHLHYHDQAEITGEMLETMYPCSSEAICPVELVAHGIPHRVLSAHGDTDHD